MLRYAKIPIYYGVELFNLTINYLPIEIALARFQDYTCTKGRYAVNAVKSFDDNIKSICYIHDTRWKKNAS